MLGVSKFTCGSIRCVGVCLCLCVYAGVCMLVCVCVSVCVLVCVRVCQLLVEGGVG